MSVGSSLSEEWEKAPHISNIQRDDDDDIYIYGSITATHYVVSLLIESVRFSQTVCQPLLSYSFTFPDSMIMSIIITG